MKGMIIFAIANIENDEDRSFIAELYNNHCELMKSVAFGYVENGYDAEEIVQIAFLKLINKVSLLKSLEHYQLSVYVISAIKTASVDFIRKRNRDTNSTFLFGDDDDIEDIPDSSTTETIALEKYDKEIIRNSINQLNKKYKMVIEYKYYQNMNDIEIAKILDIKPQSVREYLTRARNALKKILKTEHDIHGME